MSLNIVYKWSAPIPPYQCEFIEIAPEAVPAMLGALQLKASKYWWLTVEDQRLGRKMLAEQGARLLMSCGQDIVNAIDRVYRLLDSNQNGTIYSVSGDDTPESPLVFSPSMPVVPTNPGIYSEPGQRWKLDDTHDMLRNAITGIPTADYVEVDATNPLLIQIRDALAAETNAEQIELLQKIALALGAAL